MMTMTTLTADPISPRHSLNKMTIDMPSFNTKESTDSNSGIRCFSNKSFNTLPILRTFPTREFHPPTDNNVVTVVIAIVDDNLPAADDIRDSNAAKNYRIALPPTFLQEWNDFYKEFKSSMTYALAQHADSSIDDATANDDDCMMNEDNEHWKHNSSDSIRQLRRAVGNLAKVNRQFAQFVDNLCDHAPCPPPPQHLNTISQHPLPSPGPRIDRPLQSVTSLGLPPEPLGNPDNPAPCKLTFPHIANNLPHLQPCLDPPHDRMPQIVPPMAPPPAPNPTASPIQHPATQPSQIDRCPSTISHPMSPTNNHAPKIEPCAVPRPPPIQPTPIPNWAKPAAPPPATIALAGKCCKGKNHWPPPQPEKKTIPFKKPPQTKPHTANRKDFLRLP